MFDTKADMVEEPGVVAMSGWDATVDTAGDARNVTPEVALDCGVEDG